MSSTTTTKHQRFFDRIEHEDVGGGDSQDELGRDEDGDEDGGISVHDERVRASFG